MKTILTIAAALLTFAATTATAGTKSVGVFASGSVYPVQATEYTELANAGAYGTSREFNANVDFFAQYFGRGLTTESLKSMVKAGQLQLMACHGKTKVKLGYVNDYNSLSYAPWTCNEGNHIVVIDGKLAFWLEGFNPIKQKEERTRPDRARPTMTEPDPDPRPEPEPEPEPQPDPGCQKNCDKPTPRPTPKPQDDPRDCDKGHDHGHDKDRGRDKDRGWDKDRGHGKDHDRGHDHGKDRDHDGRDGHKDRGHGDHHDKGRK